MQLSTPAKSMLFLFVPVLLLWGCSSVENDNAARDPFVSEHESAIPFSTSEPERYKADVVVRAGSVERRYFLARDGERRRIDYDVGEAKHRAILKIDREYLIDFGRKILAVVGSGSEVSSVDDELVQHLLNQRHNTEFTETGIENGLTVYRAEIDGSTASEIVLYIDTATNLPMKQEFYSVEGERRELMYSVELKNVNLDLDPAVFEMPSGFREVSVAAFRKMVK